MVQYVIYILVFIAMGFLMFFRCEIFWEMVHSRDGKKDEKPTRGFLAVCRLSGIACWILAVVLFCNLIS
ncbi:MAG: DUF6199 family natural product biosynthesis protein [Eubacteriales bacterium]|jgi:hypothetical protein